MRPVYGLHGYLYSTYTLPYSKLYLHHSLGRWHNEFHQYARQYGWYNRLCFIVYHSLSHYDSFGRTSGNLLIYDSFGRSWSSFNRLFILQLASFQNVYGRFRQPVFRCLSFVPEYRTHVEIQRCRKRCDRHQTVFGTDDRFYHAIN